MSETNYASFPAKFKDAEVVERRTVLAGKQLRWRDVSLLLLQNGWVDAGKLVDGLGTIDAESLRYTEAVGGPWSNGTRDFGLFQLNEIHAAPLGLSVDAFAEKAFDVEWAANFARALYVDARSRWTPWAAFNSGLHLVERRHKSAGLGFINGLMVFRELLPISKQFATFKEV
jgi:hypothetical protein